MKADGVLGFITASQSTLGKLFLFFLVQIVGFSLNRCLLILVPRFLPMHGKEPGCEEH